ncbi:helix-turn-helix transcriptional regulator [uncultured Neptuniibacter sp.]|uniref:helix-turn-helix domain-containing protein n=1 Tax=uncultured Neptuniibacter sp. TaxID=502143 RepID=UPI0026046257|nr:helix-turn-helix transcriptional regulator [uncultured Neptuniibacter sp.]
MESLILQLKQQPVFQEKPVFALECTWENLLRELDELLTQLGFVSFTYSVLVRNNLLALGDGQAQKWESGSDIVGSMPDAIFKTYYRDIATHDPVWESLSEMEAPLILKPTPQSAYADAFWSKHGISSRVYVPMHNGESVYWFHYFGLFHSLPQGEFESFFGKVSEWVIPILNRYHALLQAVSDSEQNPFLKQELLSTTCLRIMQMTAEGMPVKRIADKLALTEEGITYHITRAKRLFGARNKTQLVAIMYKVGLL